MAANKKTKKMLNTSRGMKVISILVASCMLFALTGCGATDDSAATEPTTQVAEVKTTEATTTEATTTETTTETTTAAPTTTTAPTTEATTEATTAATTAVTTETPTEAPSLTVPDVPDNAEAQVEEHTTVAPVEDVPEDPAGEPDDGYWHEEEPAVSAADLQAAAEAELSRLAARVNETGGAWTITNTHVIRSSDTQYGIYVMVECEFGGIERAIKAEVSSSGEIIVGYWSNGANTANDGSYESFDVGPSSIDTFDFSL